MNRVLSALLSELEGPAGGREKSLTIMTAFRRAICEGRLQPGEELPSARRLAEFAGVSRGCIHRALRGLANTGLLEETPMWRVSSTPLAAEEDAARLPISGACEGRSTRNGSTRISDYAQRLMHCDPLANVSNRIDGTPPHELLPEHIWRACSKQVKDEGSEAADGAPCGWWPLRKAYANYLKRSRAIVCQAEQVIVFYARDLRMDFLSRTLLAEGDTVAVEDPGFPSARMAFASCGSRILPVPVDGRGIDVEHLMALNEPVRLLYVTPSHQQPSGVVLSPGNRTRLLNWAQTNNVIVLEDDYDHEFRYPARRMPALAAQDPQSVIHMSCPWKILSPLSTLGFLVVPERLLSGLAAAKAFIEPIVPVFDQRVLTKFINDGHLEWQIRKSKAVYARRRDALLAAIKRWFGDGAVVSPETGGTELLVRLLVVNSDESVLAAASRCGLPLSSSAPYYANDTAGGEYIIAFSHVDHEQADMRIRQFAAEVLD